MPSSLNPFAKEFYPPGHYGTSTKLHDSVADAVFPITELPMEILACIVSSLQPSMDLVHCLLACRQLHGAVKCGRVSLSLTDEHRHAFNNPANSQLLCQLIKAVVNYMPGMAVCNLSLLPLEESHISTLAAGLPHLALLDLSGCKKLQPSITKVLQQPGSLPQLQGLNLQRCFQLTDKSLSDILAWSCGIVGDSNSSSSSAAVSQLQFVALSHLNLSAWPAAVQDNAIEVSSTNSVSASRSTGAGPTFCHQLQPAVQAALHCRPTVKLPAGHTLLSAVSGSNMRILVLNNCSQLSVAGLVSLAVACPQLEYLMLGGSTLQQPHIDPSLAAVTAVTVAAQHEAEGSQQNNQAGNEPPIGSPSAVYFHPHAAASNTSGMSAITAAAANAQLPMALQQLANIVQLPTMLSWEVLNSCCQQTGGSCNTPGCTCSCRCCNPQAAVNSDMERRGPRATNRSAVCNRLIHKNEPSAATIAASRGIALGLAYAASLLPKSKAIEVTFMAPGVAGWLRVIMQGWRQLQVKGVCSSQDSITGAVDDGACSSTSSEPDLSAEGHQGNPGGCSFPKVWDFSCIAAVSEALAALQPGNGVDWHRVCPGQEHRTVTISGQPACIGASHVDQGLLLACAAGALRCAVGCSSRGRSTPLHLAAERGCACHVSALLAAGASAAARDTSGATPLFVAAEAGRADAVAVLLEAGAEPLASNAAGETSLYIAALRGHLSVVELLLGHLSAAGVDWMQSRLYGDAFTPLMAAAVANRVDVALCLLRAATGSQQQPQQHVAGQHRGVTTATQALSGQTCPSTAATMTIGAHANRSAQSGPAGLQRLLAAENRYGQTALHIAARKGCRELLRLLMLYGAGQVAGRAVDAAGDTPLDVARRHGHEMALRELLQCC